MTRVSVRLAAPLGADVVLRHIRSGARISSIEQLRQLGTGERYIAEVVTNEIKTVVNLEGKTLTTVTLGCDRCNTTDQSAAHLDMGTFTPSASRLGLAVLGNLDGQIYSNFWTQALFYFLSCRCHSRISRSLLTQHFISHSYFVADAAGIGSRHTGLALVQI